MDHFPERARKRVILQIKRRAQGDTPDPAVFKMLKDLQDELLAPETFGFDSFIKVRDIFLILKNNIDNRALDGYDLSDAHDPSFLIFFLRAFFRTICAE